MLSTRSVSVLLAILFLVSCGPRNDPHDRVIHYQGKLESELRREVGPPTREGSAASELQDDLCETRGERALTYDIPSRGAEKQVRQAFGLGPVEQKVAYVDRTGRIVCIVMVQIH